MKNYLGVVFLAVLAGAVSARVIPQNKFEAGLLKLIEKCRDGDVQSLPIAFPSLTPLSMPPTKFNYKGYTMSITAAKAKGLENLSVERLSTSLSDLKISMDISVPTLAIRADRYHLQSKPMWGLLRLIDNKGVFKSNINNLKARLDLQFAADGADTVITDLNLDYSVDDIQVQLSGSPQFVNDRVNDEVSSMMNDSEMKERIQNFIIDMTAEYLQEHTPQELIDIIFSM